MLPIYPGKSVSNFNLPFLLSLWQMLSLNSPKKLLEGLQTQIKHTVGKVLRQTLTLRPSQVPLPWKSQLTSLSPFPLFPLTRQPAPFSVIAPPGPWNLLPVTGGSISSNPSLPPPSRPLGNRLTSNDNSLLETLFLFPGIPHTFLFCVFSHLMAAPFTPGALPLDSFSFLHFLSCANHFQAHDLHCDPYVNNSLIFLTSELQRPLNTSPECVVTGVPTCKGKLLTPSQPPDTPISVNVNTSIQFFKPKAQGSVNLRSLRAHVLG